MPTALLASDDSDGGEIEVRRRKKTDGRCRPWILHLYIVLSLALFVCYLTYNQYLLRKKFNEMNETLSDLIILPTRIKVVEQDIHRLRMEFDLIRDSTSTNSSRSAAFYVYDQLTRLESEFFDLKAIVQRTHNSMEDVSRRVSTVEDRCLAVCQLDEIREKQRRRQLADKKTTHEIIFKRGGQ